MNDQSPVNKQCTADFNYQISQYQTTNLVLPDTQPDSFGGSDGLYVFSRFLEEDGVQVWQQSNRRPKHAAHAAVLLHDGTYANVGVLPVKHCTFSQSHLLLLTHFHQAQPLSRVDIQTFSTLPAQTGATRVFLCVIKMEGTTAFVRGMFDMEKVTSGHQTLMCTTKFTAPLLPFLVGTLHQVCLKTALLPGPRADRGRWKRKLGHVELGRFYLCR